MEDQQIAPARRFAISTAYIEAVGRSFDFMVEQRMCASARRRIGTMREERVPTTSGKKVSFETRSIELSPLDLIRESCGTEHDYLTHDLPLLEAIFRIFLLAGNQPMPLADLRQRIDEFPSHAERLRFMSDDDVALLFVRDSYYGLRPVDEP